MTKSHSDVDDGAGDDDCVATEGAAGAAAERDERQSPRAQLAMKDEELAAKDAELARVKAELASLLKASLRQARRAFHPPPD
eukprot:COSAG06_NODE_25050_length_646_cov_2.444241_1_plen_82_part_00